MESRVLRGIRSPFARIDYILCEKIGYNGRISTRYWYYASLKGINNSFRFIIKKYEYN